MIKILAFAASCSIAFGRIAGAAFGHTIGPNSFELLSYQDPDYRFLIIPPNATPPKGFEQRGFDDTAFTSGSGAFGSGGGCPLQSTPRRLGPLIRSFWLGVSSQFQPGRSFDNDIIGVFFNGTRVQGPVRRDGCPIQDQVVIDVPQKLIQPGQNLVAFQVVDRGVESFFDARILADLSLPVLTSSLVDLAGIADRQLPKVPVRDITVSCPDGAKETSVKYRVETTGANAQIKLHKKKLDRIYRIYCAFYA